MSKLVPVGKFDNYGVNEAKDRKAKQLEIAKGFASSPQNVWTKSSGNRAKQQANWAQTNLTNREGYQQNQTDFASWDNLDNYFNDTAGAFNSQGGSRKNKFGKQDVDYLTKVGVNQDVINTHVGGLDKDAIHQNYWNNDAAKHLHADGWDAGAHFGASDRKYVKDNDMDLLEQINKYGKARSSIKGGTSHLDNESARALRDSGQYQDYMSQFAQGHTKEAGINSYNREGNDIIGADIVYLESQGYSNKDITNWMASQKKNDKGEGKGVNHWAANWINRQGMVDTYENYQAPPTPQSNAKERAQNHLAAGGSVNNNQNNSVNDSFNTSSSSQVNNNQNNSVNDSMNSQSTTNNNQNNSVNDSNNSSSSLNYTPTSSNTTSNSNNSASTVNYDAQSTSNSNNRTQTNQQQNLLTSNSNNVTDSGNLSQTMNSDIKSGKTDSDMTFNLGNDNTVMGSSLGNDNSVTITGGSGGGMDNMMGLAAYQALNNNQFARSRQELNGTGRSAMSLRQMDDSIGAKDTAKNAYNMAGMYQQYFNDSSKAMQGSWAGDIFNFNAPSWMQGSTPSNPKDDTKNIFKNGMMQFS